MAPTSRNYNILVGVELELNDVQQQLNKKAKDTTFNVKADTSKAQASIEDLSLSFQAANEIFRTTIDIMASMANEVLKLDTALTEFSKVSDLSGNALDKYVDKLSEMGATVARTGKPKCLSRSVWMVNMH